MKKIFIQTGRGYGKNNFYDIIMPEQKIVKHSDIDWLAVAAKNPEFHKSLRTNSLLHKG